MMHRKGAAPEYSALCKWENDAWYAAPRGNWRFEKYRGLWSFLLFFLLFKVPRRALAPSRLCSKNG
jgi:hypothetical protein